MKTVLLIDDELNFLEATSVLLDLHGIPHFFAGTAKEGLALADEHLPSLVVCDFSLPDLTGIDVLQHLRSTTQHFDTPFILLSAMSGYTFPLPENAYSPTQTLYKPLSFEDLLHVINSYLHPTI
ncbi:MAG: response regulator [Chitinophagia bacterium]|nr:response regulator [Chitinophagia bacterium]